MFCGLLATMKLIGTARRKSRMLGALPKSVKTEVMRHLNVLLIDNHPEPEPIGRLLKDLRSRVLRDPL